MMLKKVEISVDTFARLWSARRVGENSEEEIINRLIDESDDPTPPETPAAPKPSDTGCPNSPPAADWVSMLVWALESLGGEATLKELYAKTMDGRRALGLPITRHHEASVRERLEAHCFESKSYKRRRNLFRMAQGKGAGVWALR